MIPNVSYGRVMHYIPKDKPRKMKNAMWGIAFWLPEWRPNWAYGSKSFLSYTVNGVYYKIYNPNRHPFDLNEVKQWICHWHLRHDKAQAKDFQILNNRA